MLVSRSLIAGTVARRIPRRGPADRVDIVAHSFGGLVGRAYIADPVRATRVDQLITLGAPQLGAAKSLKALRTAINSAPGSWDSA